MGAWLRGAGPSLRSLRILAYSHDAYGLGHLRRTIRLVGGLAARFPSASLLVATGSRAAHHFRFPDGVDYVKLPAVTKITNERYEPDGLRMNSGDVAGLRAAILETLVRGYAPDLVLVDRYAMGLGGELRAALEWLRSTRPGVRIALGLRDILDDPLTVRAEWMRKGYGELIPRLYDQVLIYGSPRIYNPIVEYSLPSSVAERTTFTGYLADAEQALWRTSRASDDSSHRVAVCTMGGGKDGAHFGAAFLGALRLLGAGWGGLLVTGPFLATRERRRLEALAAPLGVPVETFVDELPSKFADADVVVAMGGYNTMCEILAGASRAVIVPRAHPRREQLIRASLFADRGVVDLVLPQELSPEVLASTMEHRSSISRDQIRAKIDAGFDLDGIKRASSSLLGLMHGQLTGAR